MKKIIFGTIAGCCSLGLGITEQEVATPAVTPITISYQNIEERDYVTGDFSSSLDLGEKWTSIVDKEIVTADVSYGNYFAAIEVYQLTDTDYYLVDIVHVMDPSERSEFITSKVTFNHYPAAYRETERAYPFYVYPFEVIGISSNSVKTHITPSYTGYDCSLELPDDAPKVGSGIGCKAETALHERITSFDYDPILEYDSSMGTHYVNGAYHEYYYDWSANSQAYNEVKTEQRELILLKGSLYDDYYPNIFSIDVNIEVGFAKDGILSNKHDTDSIYKRIVIPAPY